MLAVREMLLPYTPFWHISEGPLKKAIPLVPDVNEFDGLLDIFSLCNVMEASNILHHKSYLKGALTVAERLQMIHGRVIARQILMWIFRNYAFEEDRSMETFYWRYLAHQLKTLCQIKHSSCFIKFCILPSSKLDSKLLSLMILLFPSPSRLSL